MTKQKPSKLEVVQNGKYAKLYQYFVDYKTNEWITTFDEVEGVLGFALPEGAKSNRAFWANGSRTHSMAWTLAGWKARDVDLTNRTVTFVLVDAGGKYRRLSQHLSDLEVTDWKTTFSEIETIIGFELPRSAYVHPAWWSNGIRGQSLSWATAGWKTSEINVNAKSLTFRKTDTSIKRKKLIESGGAISPKKRKAASTPPTLNSITPSIRRICGDARAIPIPDNSADVIITSPPYWNLRDYGVDGQLGQESTPDAYIANLIECLQEWRRVIPVWGSVFLNIGDTYLDRSLVGIPALLEIAAKKDGWILRNRIAWIKEQGMPDPAKNRLKGRHESVFHFTPQKTGYYYDQFGYAAKYGNGTTPSDVWNIGFQRNNSPHLAPFPEELVDRIITLACPYQVCSTCGEPRRRIVKRTTELDLSRPAARRAKALAEDAGLTKEHIAAIQALGISDAGKAMQTQTGGTSERVTKLAAEAKSVLRGLSREYTFPLRKSVGFSECCGPFRAGIVLDPFVGSGTSLRAAVAANRSAIGVDLDISHSGG